MSKVQITKEGFKSFEWDGDLKQNVEEKVTTFVSRLRCSCSIDSGVTLGDIFRAVDKDPELCRFLGEYSWCNVPAFHQEAVKPGAQATDLTRLELSKTICIDEEDAGEGLDFGGVGPPDDMRDQGVDQAEINWGICLTPVNELVELPVVLNNSASITKDYDRVGKSTVCFSLLEVLSEIYYEISFHGSPESRDSVGQELDQAVAEIKAGTAKLVPLEDVLGKDTIQ